MNKFILIIIIVLSPVSLAGDYMLLISDTESCSKVYHSQKSSSTELISSFQQYFMGEVPKIKVLRSAFANGHFRFCSQKEREAVLVKLKEIKASGEAHHQSHLVDFISKIEAIH